MKISTKLVLIFIILFLFSFNIISVSALDNIENILGENTTKAMLNEIKNEINKYSTITSDKILEIIKEITTIYGLNLNDDEIQNIYNYIAEDITAKITDNISLQDRIKLFIENMTRVVEETFPEVKDKDVTIIIPRLSQVDNLVRQGIYYFIRNILPLIDA